MGRGVGPEGRWVWGSAVRVGRGWLRSRWVVGWAVRVGRGAEPEGRWVVGWAVRVGRGV